MKPHHLKQLIKEKRKWTEPLTAEEVAKGFKGWYASESIPHFDAPGLRQFITYRLADAVPASKRAEWDACLALEDDLEKRRRIEAYLDQDYGECLFRDCRLAEIVQENWRYCDGKKYELLAGVVMPNHGHVVVEIWDVPLGKIIQSWKGYTAREINQVLDRNGTVWAEDFFDRYIRDEEHLRRTIRYVEQNPVKAGLVQRAEEWRWSSAHYRTNVV